jgi:hypothetical protein
MSTFSPADPKNCALDAQGNLMDANEIQFYNSEGDDTDFVYQRQHCSWPII